MFLDFEKNFYFYAQMQNKKELYQELVEYKANHRKALAILLDPDKIVWDNLAHLIVRINQSPATHIFIGGSIVESNIIDTLILRLQSAIDLPIILFPGDPSQISAHADGILFLFLISGRNPDYLIEHQVNSVPILKKMDLEVISTGYLLIESGAQTAVERVSATKPLDRNNIEYVVHTAQAGEMLGNKLIYLEAGSGAKQAVSKEMIRSVSQNIKIPLIVGGGIVDFQGMQDAYAAGADLVVIGTAFENDSEFFNSHKI